MPLPVLSDSGEAALIFDSGLMPDHVLQARVRELARFASGLAGVTQACPGVGNLMVCFDPEQTDRLTLEPLLISAWSQTQGLFQPGRLVDVPVEYGGEAGSDLEHVSQVEWVLLNELVFAK